MADAILFCINAPGWLGEIDNASPGFGSLQCDPINRLAMWLQIVFSWSRYLIRHELARIRWQLYEGVWAEGVIDGVGQRIGLGVAQYLCCMMGVGDAEGRPGPVRHL